MTGNPIHELYELGQSVWLDQISRELLADGTLARMVEAGDVSGLTSNPTIFEKAISGSSDYDDAVRDLLADHPDVGAEALYEGLAVRDIQAAADLLRPVWDRTEGVDGYVSLEVAPRLAHETATTVAEAKRLRALVDRANLLIKVPGTDAGLSAITTLIGEGVNVNVTLMFSQQNYLQVAGAYLSGLEKLASAGGDLREVASVASFFVSRIDVAVDDMLPAGSPLRGRIAVANTKLAYDLFRQTFASDRFLKLRQRGARVQRFLCASTSTKNPAYRDVLYVEELIGPDTVNTLPMETIDAFRDHGRAAQTITEDLDGARDYLAALEEAGIDLNAVCRELQVEGVAKFAKSYDSLVEALAQKSDRILTSSSH